MDKSSRLDLLTETFTTDTIGQRIPAYTYKTVFANVQSVTRNEFFEAGKAGIKPEHVATMFLYDYDGEQMAELPRFIRGAVALNATTWAAGPKGQTPGIYRFTRDTAAWKLAGQTVTLATYGITYTGTPKKGTIIEVDSRAGNDALRVDTFLPERFKVYRTYEAKTDEIELYLSKLG